MGIEIQSTKEQKFLSDLKDIVATAKCRGYEAVNQVIVTCNWLIGRRIVEQEQQGKERAEYGKFVIKKASEFLTDEFGKGYSVTNLKNFRSFYLPNLSWSHYECLLRVKDIDARNWYLNEAASEKWSVRTLDRNISSQYYYRLLQTPQELGRGFAFVARQKHVKTDVGDYYIDLVFYNYILKCFLLVDLKTSQVTHQDIGQMDMYIRMYDELECTNGDNPTIGLLLCAETSKDLARYSILRDSNQLFAAKYMTYLPKKEELLLEIERQKYLFELQQGKKMRDK